MFLTNFPDEVKIKSNGEYEIRNRVYITFDVEKKLMTTRFEMIDSTGDKSLSSSGQQKFSLRISDAPAFNPNEPMYWGILFNRTERVIRMRLIGSSAKYFPSEVAIRDIPATFTDLGWMGFNKCNKPYSVWDLSFTDGIDTDLFH